MLIQGTSAQSLTPQGTGQGIDSSQQKGSFRGEQATVRDASSRLADAAEELTFSFSKKVEKKKAGERDVRTESRLQLMRIAEINQYLDAAKSPRTPAELTALAKRMLSAQQSPGQLARQASEDPTQQSLFLQFALQEGERTGAPAKALDAVRDALTDLEMECGPAIRAGLNSIDAASAFGSSADSIQNFQKTYRDVALGSASLVETLKLALDRFGGTDFARGLKSLLQALGADVAALRPSNQPARLLAVVQDIYQLEVFNTLLDQSEKLGKLLLKRHGTDHFDGVEFMKHLVSITGDRWLAPSRFLEMSGRFEINQIEAQVHLVAHSLQMLRDMPIKIFADSDTRRTVLDAGQEALDSIIEQEESLADDDFGVDEQEVKPATDPAPGTGAIQKGTTS